MDQKQAFGKSLRTLRKLRGLTQEDFGLVSSRTYISMLERGEKNPTLEKVAQLSSELGINPGTLVMLALAYESGKSPDELLQIVKSELQVLGADV